MIQRKVHDNMIVKSQNKLNEVDFASCFWGVLIDRPKSRIGSRGGTIIATEHATFRRHVMGRFANEDYARLVLREIRYRAAEKKRTYSIKKDSPLIGCVDISM